MMQRKRDEWWRSKGVGARPREDKKLADSETRVIFGGRLGEYKYYDMDKVIASALEMSSREL